MYSYLPIRWNRVSFSWLHFHSKQRFLFYPHPVQMVPSIGSDIPPLLFCKEVMYTHCMYYFSNEEYVLQVDIQQFHKQFITRQFTKVQAYRMSVKPLSLSASQSLVLEQLSIRTVLVIKFLPCFFFYFLKQKQKLLQNFFFVFTIHITNK